MAQTACENCGFQLAPGDAFCGSCGHRGSGSAPAITVEGPAAGQMRSTEATGDGIGAPLTGRASGAMLDAALGQATVNTTYLGQRLLYEKTPEPGFDPLTNTRYLLELLRQAVIYWLLFWIGAGVSAIFFAIVSLAVGPKAALTLGIICAVLSCLVIGALFWLLPVPALLSEWKFAVDGKAPAAPVTFEHITWALRRHQTPLDSVRVRRLRLPGEETRDYLELRRGIFSGFVGCFGYGQDLYVGWTFWLNLSPLRWLLMLLARIWQSVTRRGTDLYVTLRYDSARAMREAMHSTAREGVDVAVGQLPPQGRGIIGADVPVDVTVIGS